MSDIQPIEANDLDAKIRYAKTLATADLLPQQYRNNPANVLIAFEHAAQLGIGNTEAMYQINVINGTPSLSAQMMRALVLRAGHRLHVVETTETKAVLKCARRDYPDDVSLFEYSIEDAQRAGLAGSATWKKNPKAMLLARVSTLACRTMFADCLAGFAYDADEVAEFARPAAAEPVQTTQPLPKPAIGSIDTATGEVSE